MSAVAAALHEHCEAGQDRGMTRLQAIERWLGQYHEGEPVVIVDDQESGTGLRGSVPDRARRVVLCDVNVGLHAGHLPDLRAALTREYSPREAGMAADMYRLPDQAAGAALRKLRRRR